LQPNFPGSKNIAIFSFGYMLFCCGEKNLPEGLSPLALFPAHISSQTKLVLTGISNGE